MEVGHSAAPLLGKSPKSLTTLALFYMQELSLLTGHCITIDYTHSDREVVNVRIDAALKKQLFWVELISKDDATTFWYTPAQLHEVRDFIY